MPLHGDQVVVALCLDGLHKAVVGPCGHAKPVTDPVDALVVVAVHGESSGADEAGEPGFGIHLHDVLSEDAAADPVPLGAERLGQVLVQRATEGDVEQLQAAADAEDRDAALPRPRQQRELPRVAVGARGVGERVALGAVQLGLHVEAAGEDETVEPVEHGRGGLLRTRLRGQQHRAGSRRGHRVEVLLGQKGCPDVPDALLRPLQIGRQPDDGGPARIRGARNHAPAPNRSRRRRRLPPRCAPGSDSARRHRRRRLRGRSSTR